MKDEFGFPHQEGEEPVENLITWVFEEGTFRPTARLKGDKAYSIISDYLGTPVEMYNDQGQKTWEARLDIYGKVANFAGSSLNDCPFRYQGQYEDSETGLYYNRFRYYSPGEGMYLSQDPIKLAGGNPTLYGYVQDVNSWVDELGLNCIPVPSNTQAANGLLYRSNPKHTLGQPGNRMNAGLEPSNSLDLFGKSRLGSDGNRYTKDANNTIHRFFSTNDGTWHWSGSTNQVAPRPSLTGQDVPNDIKNIFNLKKKGW